MSTRLHQLKPHDDPNGVKMIIAGFDLSLNASGMARVDTDDLSYTAATFKPPKGYADGHPRLGWILDRVEEQAAGAALALVEEPAYGARGTAVHTLAGNWYLVTHRLWQLKIPTVIVNVASLKMYATGNGSADKDLIMLVTGREFLDFAGDNNAADALWLACMGAHYMGRPLRPRTARQYAALAKVTWL